MLKLLRPLITLLGLGLLTAHAASALAAVPAEKPASGSLAAADNRVSQNTRLSEEAVRENLDLSYDFASDSPVAAEGAGEAVTVGRWMSQTELDAMQATGRVQESFSNGVTSVTLPPNPAAYTNAPVGDVFVRFDVPQSAIGASDGVWGKIFGPNSIFGPVRGITEMPPATNIVVPGP